MSESFDRWLASLSLEDREKFVEMMKDDNTYFADSFEDIVAILGQIQKEKNIH